MEGCSGCTIKDERIRLAMKMVAVLLDRDYRHGTKLEKWELDKVKPLKITHVHHEGSIELRMEKDDHGSESRET